MRYVRRSYEEAQPFRVRFEVGVSAGTSACRRFPILSGVSGVFGAECVSPCQRWYLSNKAPGLLADFVMGGVFGVFIATVFNNPHTFVNPMTLVNRPERVDATHWQTQSVAGEG
jgi:hypothetical protein